MENKAANNGAAFAAFRKNLEHLLVKNEIRIVIDEPEQAFRDIFKFWRIGMQTYFENLLRVGISLSAETNTRWLSQAMIIEIGDADGSGLPEECRPFLEYGERFFGIFSREYSGGTENGDEGENRLSFVLTELAMEALVAVFLREVAMFAPACSDGRSVCGTAGAQIIPLLQRKERVH